MMLSVAGRTVRRISQRNIIRSHQASSSAFADNVISRIIPESVRDAVKSSVLDDAIKHDSKLWNESQRKMSKIKIINSPISPSHHDPLDEWCLTGTPHNTIPSSIAPVTQADPFTLVSTDINRLSETIRTDLIQTSHPVLQKAASYFFQESVPSGKKVRPMMVMLLSRALLDSTAENTHDSIIERQHRLAEISEMIHIASLFHDDVIDDADTRRGVPAVHKVFGNKMAILAGDYLLARASIFLARLRDLEVVECMSTIIEHLVRGEVMQMKNTASTDPNEMMQYYLEKNFFKTGSLMANSCKSAAILGGAQHNIVDAAYRYGKHVGLAFQLVDDVLDFEGNEVTMGKPNLSDLNAGLATAPVLFAVELKPDLLIPLIQRKFKQKGDVQLALDVVRSTNGIQRTKDLAQVHAELAIDAVMELDQSDYRDALIHLALKVVDRKS